MRYWISIAIAAVVFSLKVTSHAQTFVEGQSGAGQSGHRYWDRANLWLLGSHVAIEAADFGITHVNISGGGREENPIGRSLCESGMLGQSFYFGARSAAVLGASYLAHRLGRHRVERVIFLVADVDSSDGLGYSLLHR